MAFLLIGLVAALMKYLEFGPVAAWPWYVVLSPFITQGMVRVAVGLEHLGDLQADLNRGFDTLP